MHAQSITVHEFVNCSLTADYVSTPTPTPYNNAKIVIIVVQCDKNYAVLTCACAVAPYVS